MGTPTTDLTSFMSHPRARRTEVRWYVLTLPACHRGAARTLKQERAWRKNHGDESFEYFAPEYTDAYDGALGARRPLFYNYVFVRASELDILQMKSRRPMLNFLRRVADADGGHFPYLSDECMANLKRVAAAYSAPLPAYAPEPSMLRRGDRVRIIGGRFDGVEATLLRAPANARDELVVCVDNWMWVPVVHVEPGHYQVLELSSEGKAKYAVLDNENTTSRLRAALIDTLNISGPNASDRALASETALRYGRLNPTSKVLKAKHTALMLQAYAVAGDTAALAATASEAESLLREVRAEQSRALLLAAIYCTTRRHRSETLAAIDQWRNETHPKKSKRTLIEWVDAMDQAYQNHTRSL